MLISVPLEWDDYTGQQVIMSTLALTETEAVALLMDDLVRFEDCVNARIKVPHEQSPSALVS